MPDSSYAGAVMIIIGCLLLFALFAYLLYALIKPEQF